MRILFFGFLLVAVSCNQNRSDKDLLQYVNRRQLLNLNGLTRDGKTLENPRIERISPDTVSVGELFLAKILISDRRYELSAAYFDCKTAENPTVDTLVDTSNNSMRLDGCTKGLFVENDTIFISFTPSVSGTKTFEEITLLTRYNDKLFRTQKYTFSYYVAEN